MRGERVAWAGQAVQENAAHLVEVDLQGNLLWDWEEVACLARPMPRLEVLHLNGNLMLPLSGGPAPTLRDAFPVLRTLVINSCDLRSWATVATLEACLPQLEELAVANNDLGDIDVVCQGRPVQGFLRLQRLDMSAAGLVIWGQVQLLARLPELRSLHLSDNALEGTRAPGGEATDGAETDSGFAALEALHLSGNHIGDWAEIDRLNCFPRLTGLRFVANPLTRGMGQSEARQIIIGRVRGLTRLNGADVSRREREEAEKSYLRRVARELANAAAQSEDQAREVRGRHPRYEELQAAYGDSGAAHNTGAEGTRSLATEMLALTLVSMATGSMTMAPTEKRLPASMTVGRLKQMLHRKFGLEPSLQSLYFKSDKTAPPSMLDSDDEPLSYFGVSSGCEVFMNEIDKAEQAREEAAQKREEQLRLEEELARVEKLNRFRKAQISSETAGVQRAVQGVEL
jgi:tubulin-specific chaperone E